MKIRTDSKINKVSDEEIMKECYVICTSCETDYGKGNTVCPHCGHHERRPYES